MCIFASHDCIQSLVSYGFCPSITVKHIAFVKCCWLLAALFCVGVKVLVQCYTYFSSNFVSRDWRISSSRWFNIFFSFLLFQFLPEVIRFSTLC